MMAKCTHYTPAEDQSDWAYLHRTWGCPNEGAEWPEDAIRELARSNPGLYGQIKKKSAREPHCRVCAAQTNPADQWEIDFALPPLQPDNRLEAEYAKMMAGPLMTEFGRDESYAREANEFGY